MYGDKALWLRDLGEDAARNIKILSNMMVDLNAVVDVDPRGEYDSCFTVSDKALAVGGGVLEALLHLGLLQRGILVP